ncbi:MAG: MBOAT family protein [Planctomycetes bacterium]|nr:MBOAT family protein [Planctomycetota bacterium]
MSFAELEFLPFLVLVVGLFAYVPQRLRGLFLLVASYAFYLQAVPWHALLLAGSTLVDYGVGLGLGRARHRGARRGLLGTSLALNLGALALFKYSGFVADNLDALLAHGGAAPLAWPRLALPLGISFYTFQTLAYTIDVYRGTIAPCRSFTTFALYVSFFPQLVAGPIERAGHLIPQLERVQVVDLERLSRGGRLVLWGLVKKLLLAEHLARHVRPVFGAPEGRGALALTAAAVGMNAVLYLDFSAYTDLARGAARLFGVELVENFRRPFLSRSVAEFASRWHMSLFRWIGDYVHSPLTHGRASHWRLWRNNLLTMGLFGFWHGASWTFLLWGLGSGVAISAQSSLRLARARRGVRRELGGPWRARDWAACLATTLFTSAFVVFFFSPDLAFAERWFGALATTTLAADPTWLAWTVGALLLGLAGQAVAERYDLERAWRRVGWAGRGALVLGCVAALVWLRVPAPEPFVYFRF